MKNFDGNNHYRANEDRQEQGRQSNDSPRVAAQPSNTCSARAPEKAVPLNEQKKLVALFQTGHYAELENCGRLLVKKYPSSGFIWKVLGVSLLSQGKNALPELKKTAELLPQDAEAHNNFGIALQNIGQLDKAEECFRRALSIKPVYPEAHNNLGNALQLMGKLDAAVASYQHALELQPNQAKTHNNLGNAFQKLGRLDDALTSYINALRINFNDAETHCNLGNILKELGKIEDAIASCRRAIDLNPSYAEAHHNLAVALAEIEQISSASESFRKALEFNPLLARAHSGLGSVLRHTNHAEAEACCQKALEIDPDLIEAIILKANLLADKGEFSEAENLFNRAKSTNPDTQEAWTGIARIRKMSKSDIDWLTNVEKITRSTLVPRKEVPLRYALGKYYDDVKEYGQAFPNYRRANELAKQYGSTFDRQLHTVKTNVISSVYNQEWIAQRRAHGNTSTRPLFIVGMPRSGTSLVEQIISSHPSVFGAGEIEFWHEAIAEADPSSLAGEAGDRLLDTMAGKYLELLQGFSTDALRVVDKMPANFRFLGLIHAAFPNARIIHMQRNPIDTCLSIYFQNFTASHSYANDLDDLAHYYKEYVRTMQHWRSTLPNDVLLDVPYEKLVDDQEGWSRKILEFIGLPWDDRCINFDKNERSVVTASSWQVRQKIGKTSVERWRNYEQFAGPLLHLLEQDQKVVV